MRIHIGWAILGAILSAIGGGVLVFTNLQSYFDIKMASVLMEGQMANYKALNRAYVAMDSANPEEAKKLIKAVSTTNYTIVKDVSSVMSGGLYGEVLESDIQRAEVFLLEHKDDLMLRK